MGKRRDELVLLIDERIRLFAVVLLDLLMDDEEADLARAIFIDPGDEDNWLDYADWLDARGRTRQAEKLRRVVE